MHCSWATPNYRLQLNYGTRSLAINPGPSQDHSIRSDKEYTHEYAVAIDRLVRGSTYRPDGTRSQIRVTQARLSKVGDYSVKQWSAVKTAQTALVCTAIGLFLCSPCWRNFLRAKIDIPLLLPNTSVLVIPQTLVHEARGTCHYNGHVPFDNKYNSPTWSTPRSLQEWWYCRWRCPLA